MNWENYRTKHGAIDLHGALRDLVQSRPMRPDNWRKALKFLDDLEEISLITQGEAAAVAAAHALEIACR